MSLSKQFNFRPREYAAPSQGVRSKKIIRTWAHALKSVKMQKQSPKDKKAPSPLQPRNDSPAAA
jgi:hypothetical protein